MFDCAVGKLCLKRCLNQAISILAPKVVGARGQQRIVLVRPHRSSWQGRPRRPSTSFSPQGKESSQPPRRASKVVATHRHVWWGATRTAHTSHLILCDIKRHFGVSIVAKGASLADSVGHARWGHSPTATLRPWPWGPAWCSWR